MGRSTERANSQTVVSVEEIIKVPVARINHSSKVLRLEKFTRSLGLEPFDFKLYTLNFKL